MLLIILLFICIKLNIFEDILLKINTEFYFLNSNNYTVVPKRNFVIDEIHVISNNSFSFSLKKISTNICILKQQNTNLNMNGI